MKFIELSKGKKAIVDNEDYEYLVQWKWFCNSYGYAVRSVRIGDKNTVVFMHRFLLGVSRNFVIDHKNGNPLDNRRFNLRICTQQQNQFNQRKQLGRSSIFKGVHWKKGHGFWESSIKVNQKKHHIGYFKQEHHAALAYDFWATFFFGEYAHTNFPVIC